MNEQRSPIDEQQLNQFIEKFTAYIKRIAAFWRATHPKNREILPDQLSDVLQKCAHGWLDANITEFMNILNAGDINANLDDRLEYACDKLWKRLNDLFKKGV